MRRITEIGIWGAGILMGLLLLAIAASFFLEEPLRRRMEEKMNHALQGYRVELPQLDLNPFRLSITLENIELIQKKYPDLPLGKIDRLRASVHWKALLRARLVADFQVDQPVFHLNLKQVQEEAANDVPLEERGWQEAVNAVYPLKINVLNVTGGRFVYIDEDPERPLVLSDISLQAENIRNVRSPERVYPSPFRFRARVFETGRADFDGRANFLAIPHPSMEAELRVQEIALENFHPIFARYHLAVSGGKLTADGRVEYTPESTTARLKSVHITGIKSDYIHTLQAAPTAEAQLEKAKEAAKEVGNKPGLLLGIDNLYLAGELGFINKAVTPAYRLFVHQADLHLVNLSNQFRQGPAEARLTGQFMGSGNTEILASFRPEQNGPDFDLHCRIVETEMKAMNDLLMAYGDFDVTAGKFSLFTEIQVQNQRVQGYVKPFFRGLDVYDSSQDEEKKLFQQLYEGLVDGIASLLKNEASEKVATKADISGNLEDPDASTWQIIANLIRNAFFDVILPGFEETVQSESE